MAKGKKKSAKTPLLIVVLVLLIIVFAGLCVFYFGLKHYLGKTNYVDDSEVTINYGLLTADEDLSLIHILQAAASSVYRLLQLP